VIFTGVNYIDANYRLNFYVIMQIRKSEYKRKLEVFAYSV